MQADRHVVSAGSEVPLPGRASHYCLWGRWHGMTLLGIPFEVGGWF